MSEPVRVGLVGYGFAAWFLKLPSYRALDDVEIVAVADPRPEGRAEAREQLGLGEDAVYADHEEMLGRGDLDFVDVSTPHHTHAAILLDAAAAGVPAVCDKPLAMSLAQADEVIGGFERAGVKAGVYRNFLPFPGWSKAVELVAGEAIGAPRQATIVGTSIYAPGLDDDDPSGDLGWRPHVAVSGGGIFIDYGIHMIYLARTLLGGGQPQRVTSRIASLGGAAGNVEDRGTLILDWADGRRAVLDMSWGSGTTGAAIVQGDGGTLKVRYESGKASPHNVAGGVTVLRGRDQEEDHPVDWSSQPFDWYYRGSIRAFADEVRGAGDGSSPTLGDGRSDLEVVLAAYKSAGLGETVTLPLTASDPVYQRGAQGLADLDLPADGDVRRFDLFR